MKKQNLFLFKVTLSTLLIILNLDGIAQQLKPGFIKAEYKELMLISTRTTASADYYNKYPEPSYFKMVYQSQPIGLDNLWDYWVSENKVAAISLRGTTLKPESWLANFYAAMVPAKGSISLGNGETFPYELATDPKAAVHVGWLISMGTLSKEIVPQIKNSYAEGIKDFLIIGHSQGGGIAYLLTAHLLYLQKNNQLPSDIQFKTYCSAAPKPGNLYFAYEYEANTQAGWAYNVVNAADWVPEVPISIQTLNDFNNINPFSNAKEIISKQKFPQKLVLKHIYKKLEKPNRIAQKNYEQYLGKMTSKIIPKYIKRYMPPKYYNSNHYVRTGATIVLLPDDSYYKAFPVKEKDLFPHHLHAQYLFLLEKFKDSSILSGAASLTYTPTEKEMVTAELKLVPPKRIVTIHTQFGLQIPDFSNLNPVLISNGFTKLNNVYFSRGGGFFTLFTKTRIVSLFNYATYSSTNVDGNLSYSIRGTTVGTSIGYNISKKPALQITPYLGIVYSWFGVNLSNGLLSSQQFNPFLGGSPNQLHISTNGFTGNFGVQVSTTPFKKERFKDLTLGMRSGYNIPLENIKWESNGSRLGDGPNINPQGYYAHFMIGFRL